MLLRKKNANEASTNGMNIATSNPFDTLDMDDVDVNGIPCTTPIVEKIGKLEKLISDGKATLIDDDGMPLKKVDYAGDHDIEDEVESVNNDMASFLASGMPDIASCSKGETGNGGGGEKSLLESERESYGDDPYDDDPYDNDKVSSCCGPCYAI